MSNTAIYIKTEPETKKQAQKVAKELGLNLSTVINGFLKQFIKTKTVIFSSADEEPNQYARKIIKQAEENLKTGNHSPIFKTGKEAVDWLDKQGV